MPSDNQNIILNNKTMTPNVRTSVNNPSQTILSAIAAFPTDYDEYNWRPGQETAPECPMVLGTLKGQASRKHFARVIRKK